MIQLTDEEILHALEHCEDCVGCAHCIYTHKNVECNNTNDAVKLIRRLQSDLETCSNIEKQEKATNYELRTEIERLKIYIKNEKNWGKIQAKQAVKDTAKEILDDLRNIFIEQSSYGCDTNQHIGYYDYEIKLGLVVEQIDEYAKEKYGIEYGVEVE